MIQPKHKTGRNDPCKCGSKLKFKWCHGDAVKQMLCNRVANEHMVHLIQQEQIKRGLLKLRYLCNGCGKQFMDLKTSAIAGGNGLYEVCPHCDSLNFVEQGE